MRICLLSTEETAWGGLGHSRRRMASLLAERHEVTLLHTAASAPRESVAGDPRVREVFTEPSASLAQIDFACEDHRRSAAALEAIETAYSAGEPPDVIDVPDYHGHGVVALQARDTGHPLLANTLICTQISSSAELILLNDAALAHAGAALVCDLERTQLRISDRILWRGGDTLDLYRRHYGFELPEAVRIRAPMPRPAAPPRPPSRDHREPLRLLYVGRLQRCKGALDLAEACMSLGTDDWRLTMIGADTATGPAGQSVQLSIEAMCAGDPRVTIEEPLPHEELQRRLQDHDLLVVPSRFEVWSNVVLEGMRAGLPILATPVGGLAEMVEPGESGWHSEGVGSLAVARALETLLERREEVEQMRTSGTVYERFLRLTDPGDILDSYERLLLPAKVKQSSAPRSQPSPPTRRREPPVTGIVPYYRTSDYVAEAVGSLLDQTHRNLDVLIVNDGSFDEADAVLGDLARDPRVRVVNQVNQGESAARNLGALLATGEFLAMVDADNVLEPELVERALEAFRLQPQLAYVTSWLRMIGPDGLPLSPDRGYAPLGNGVVSGDEQNWDGDALAVLPRRIFAELGYRYATEGMIQADWELYRALREDGRFGVVIPECLMRYRVLPNSILRAHDEETHRRAWDEARDRRRARRTRWTVEP